MIRLLPPRSGDRRLRAVAAQALTLFGLLALSTTVAIAATAGGGGMPWEGPLNQLLTSLSGPVARVIGGVAIIGLGIGLAFSEGGSTMRKALWVVIGLALAFNALTWGLSFLGFSGGLVV